MTFDPTPGFSLGITNTLKTLGKNFANTVPSFGIDSKGNEVVYPTDVSAFTPSGSSNTSTTSGSASGSSGSTGDVLNSTTTTPNISTSSTPSYSSSDLAALDQQKALYERLLSSVGSTEKSGLQKLLDSYTSSVNNANTDRSRALETFGTQRADTQLAQQKALNAVGDNSRMLRNSLMRQLGLASSGGSAFDVAGNAVAREASKNRADVQDTYGANWRDIATAERYAESDYQKLLNEIAADRASKTEDFKAGILGNRQSILQSLAQIEADRAALLGGSQTASAQPYVDQYLALQNQIDALPGQYRTAVDSRGLDVNVPSLRDYTVDRATLNQQGAAQQQYSPYSQFLNKKEEDNTL